MHTHPKVAAVASQNWPFRHDAKCEPLLKFLKANIHEASSHAYPLNLPTRVREDPEKNVPLSYAHSDWQDRLVQIARNLIRQTEADGVFLDSGPWRLNERVETKGEVVRASPLEHSRAFFDLVDRVRREIQKERPDAVVMSETMSGPGVRHLDGAVSADLEPNLFPMRSAIRGRLHATPTRYAVSSANIFGNGISVFDLKSDIRGRTQPGSRCQLAKLG